MHPLERRSPAGGPGNEEMQSNGQRLQHDYNATGALLSRLDSVRKTGRGQWLARCPAHDDRSPSLSIRECSDGTVLLHCFAQCTALEVTQAVGLELRDLFPHTGYAAPKRRYERRINPADALRALDHEALLVSTIAGDVYRNREISADDWGRLLTAVSRIGSAREVCHV